MGLDMYLHAEEHLSKWSDEALHSALTSQLAGVFPVTAEHSPIVVQVNAAYWRKANQVHSWFVRNVQDGEDDCERYWVSREKLTELRDTCKRILDTITWGEPVKERGILGPYEMFPDFSMDEDLASELMEPVSGFFFGSTEYGYRYGQDMKYTVEQLTKILNAYPEDGRVSFYYQSSW